MFAQQPALSMNYSNTYKSVTNSHYFSEGLRITSGVLLPAFLLGYFNLLSTGIAISLGALFVSITDSPGPVHHRKNGMVACIAALLVVTLLAGFFAQSPILLTALLVVACFFFSMIAIYGARAASVGTASIIVLIISLDPRTALPTAESVIIHSLLIASGGLWYLCFSMLLYNVRPYRLPQQALGDYVETTAHYFSTRAELYNSKADFESTFQNLLQQQAVVQQKETELSELLFKTRNIVKELTNIGRTLVMIHLEVANLFEQIIMSHQRYANLQAQFHDTGILEDFYHLAKALSAQLENIGVAIKSGETSVPSADLDEQVSQTAQKLDAMRLSHLTAENIEGFITLRQVLQNLQDLASRISILHKYTSYDAMLVKKAPPNESFDKMIRHQEITPALFVTNLTLRSDTFRHSLRVSIAILVGFLTTQFLNFGHSYWILLTIAVIMKPAFSLTKKRNGHRLAGTIAGVVIGMLLLYTIHNETILLVLLVLFMIAAYSTMRLNYFVMVLFMTPYLLLFYHFLHPQNFTLILKDRVIDTLTGSVIAFLASTFLFPYWERSKIGPLMTTMVEEIKNYFTVIAAAFSGAELTGADRQLARKNVFVALANLSDAFTRMLSEPKTQQHGARDIYQFVVLCNTLTSYMATLANFPLPANSTTQHELQKVAAEIGRFLSATLNCLGTGEKIAVQPAQHDPLKVLNQQANLLLAQRKLELQQGQLETTTRKNLFQTQSLVSQVNLIYNAAVELCKITKKINMAGL